MTENSEQQNAEQRRSPGSTTGAEIARWADVAMYTSEPIQASEGPKVTLLSGPSDPLGLIAAQAKTYVGEFVNDLSEITDEERRHYLAEIQKTALAMPLEAVLFNFSITGVTRSFTHQMVRQRTAAYAQESLRFSVVEEDFTDRVALPPELANVSRANIDAIRRAYERSRFAAQEARSFDAFEANEEWFEDQIDRLSDAERQLWHWEMGVNAAQSAYSTLVATGLPAESARGLLPHNITTRIKYNTNMRALLEHIGLRTCTQAQFEWRGVAFQMMQALRAYGSRQKYWASIGKVRSGSVQALDEEGKPSGTPWDLTGAKGSVENSSAWQYDEIAKLFSPVCYRKGKCTMMASFDRKCSIRDRVEKFAEFNVPSNRWHLPLYVHEVVGEGPDTYGPEAEKVLVQPINASEWMLDPSAAR